MQIGRYRASKKMIPPVCLSHLFFYIFLLRMVCCPTHNHNDEKDIKNIPIHKKNSNNNNLKIVNSSTVRR